MTIQAWLTGDSIQQRIAEQGIYSLLSGPTAISQTISQTAATPLPTDFIVLTGLSAPGAVKLFGGSDTPNTPGPCTIADTMTIANHTGQNVTVYPPLGGSVKNLAVNTGYVVATGLLAQCTYLGSGNWALSAA